MIRFTSNDITPGRVYGAIKRRVLDVPHFVSWRLTPQAEEERARWLRSKNKHNDETCILIANGPSVAAMDLSIIKNKISFGVNRIYLLREKFPYIPTYYCCVNELLLEQFAADILDLTVPKFLNWNKRNLFGFAASTVFFRSRFAISDGFSTDAIGGLYSGGSVTYTALQIIYHMGFRKVIIIGLDHNYREKGIPGKTEVRDQRDDESHFHRDYFPRGTKWQLPDLRRSEIAFKRAKLAFEADGREIIDATVDGQCEVFEKGDFYRLISSDLGTAK
jgi:hypothetical protein